jgi:YVTN family beta-propeller protein
MILRLFFFLVCYKMALSATPPRAFVANSGTNDVSVIDLTTNTLLTTITTSVGGSPTNLAATPDGSKVYVVNISTNNIDVIDNSVTPPVLLSGGSYPISVGTLPNLMVINPAGTKGFVGNSPDVSVIDITTDTLTSTITPPTLPRGLTITPDGQHLYVGSRNSPQVNVYDVTTEAAGLPIVSLAQRASMVFATPSSGSPIFVVDNFGSTVSYFPDSFTGAPVSDPGGIYSSPVTPAMTPNGSKIYVPNSGSSDVALIDILSTTLATFNSSISLPGSSPQYAASNPAGTIVYVTDGALANVYAINTFTQAVTTIPVAFVNDVVAVSSDGSRVVLTCSASDAAVIIDTSNNSTTTINLAPGASPSFVLIPASSSVPPTPTPTPTPSSSIPLVIAQATTQQNTQLVDQTITNALNQIQDTGIVGVIEGTYPDTINSYIIDSTTPFTTDIQIPTIWCQ